MDPNDPNDPIAKLVVTERLKVHGAAVKLATSRREALRRLIGNELADAINLRLSLDQETALFTYQGMEWLVSNADGENRHAWSPDWVSISLVGGEFGNHRRVESALKFAQYLYSAWEESRQPSRAEDAYRDEDDG